MFTSIVEKRFKWVKQAYKNTRVQAEGSRRVVVGVCICLFFVCVCVCVGVRVGVKRVTAMQDLGVRTCERLLALVSDRIVPTSHKAGEKTERPHTEGGDLEHESPSDKSEPR
jgi:hypothetical protein